ncbi:MAG: sugar kinase [Phycisphaerales bacterium]|nr:MAG: sugar kinase [Phycisphaerales bacterium]
MSLLVTGSIGIDSVQTPYGQASDVLGGSAVYFSFAATYYTPVRLVGAVGGDFPEEFRKVLGEREIDLAGLETRAASKSFRWSGSYAGDMNEAETLETKLNVLAEEAPKLPEAFRDSAFVFLANTHPALQRDLVSQLTSPKLIVCDTMNLWIETTREELLRTLRVIDGLVLNYGEARMLTGEQNLLTAGRGILKLGPRVVVIKKGEHGAMMVTPKGVLVLPAFPSEKVRDPTGAGDSFAGGMMGYLAHADRTDEAAWREALVRGTITASINIEDFSLNALRRTKRADAEKRVEQYLAMMPGG